MIGGDKPCASLAGSNAFAVSEAALPTSFTFSLAQPTTLAEMPYVTAAARTSALTTYAALTHGGEGDRDRPRAERSCSSQTPT